MAASRLNFVAGSWLCITLITNSNVLFLPCNAFAPSSKNNNAPTTSLSLTAPSGSKNSKGRAGSIELGIQTAQLLMDPRKHKTLKERISKQYPWVPAGALDSAVTLVANGFTSLAPKELQQALQPGGMEQARPHIRMAMTSAIMQQPSVQDFKFLKEDGKKQLFARLVDMALDEVLKDSEWVLARPEVRLEALEMEVKQVRAEMGSWRLFKYRLRQRPGLYSSILLSVTIRAFIYQQGSVALAAVTVKECMMAAFVFVQNTLTALEPLYKPLYSKLYSCATNVLTHSRGLFLSVMG
jgi:hypothetical protein